MRNLERVWPLFLAITLALSLTITACAAAGDTGYSDVAADEWYAEAVTWCRENKIMNGTSDTTFDPDGTLTRAMLTTMLHRAEGTPAADGSANVTFTDNIAGTYYHDAVVWAASKGIITGYGDGRFGSNDPVTREQLATILWRHDGEKDAETVSFPDASDISSYARTAVDWAADKGVLLVREDGSVAPRMAAVRAEVAAALMAYLKSDSEATKPAPEPTPEPTGSGKTLVAYFSATGNTKGIAEKVAASLDNADLYEITPAQPYTPADLDYNNDCRANREQDDDSARPAISGTVENMEDYDVVFIGYPIWWGRSPRIIYTFLESYDFGGKTVIPFCTSGSSGYDDSGIKDLVSGDTTWLTGKRFSGSDSQSTVQTWVDGLNLKKENASANGTDGFVKVNGGKFTMGSPSDEAEREDDEIPHEVTVGSFWLSPTEVTQKEYEAVIGSNPSEQKGDNLPVTNVSWYDAVNYCNALSSANGLTEAYTVNGTTVTWNEAADGYRLPTEAEWEYAARADTKTPFSFGDYVRDTDANCYNAYGYNNNASGSWVNGYLEHTVDVKSYPANANGLSEIHGNAAEWVWDWYGEYNTTAVTNPAGPDTGSYKVARGGAWNDFPKHIRSAYRSANAPDVGTYGIGIRLARGAVEGAGTVTSTFSAVEQKPDKKVLIAYFSQTGNTKGLTDIIAEMTGADVFHIERTTDYSSTHNSQGLYAEALDELRAVAVPDLKTSLADAGYNINEYDTILLGYCNWWASIPAPVRSFLKTNDLSGKTIIPYCSMGGGRFGQTISAVAKLAPDSNIKAGLDTVYSSYDRDRIHNWLADNGIPAK